MFTILKEKATRDLRDKVYTCSLPFLAYFSYFFFTITPSEMYHLTETMPVSKKSISLLRALYESNHTFYGTVSD